VSTRMTRGCCEDSTNFKLYSLFAVHEMRRTLYAQRRTDGQCNKLLTVVGRLLTTVLTDDRTCNVYVFILSPHQLHASAARRAAMHDLSTARVGAVTQ